MNAPTRDAVSKLIAGEKFNPILHVSNEIFAHLLTVLQVISVKLIKGQPTGDRSKYALCRIVLFNIW